MVGAGNCFFDGDSGFVSECANVFDKAFGGAKTADESSCQRSSGGEVC